MAKNVKKGTETDVNKQKTSAPSHRGEYLEELEGILRNKEVDRINPEIPGKMYNLLKKEIDIINNIPENNKYLEEFSQWTEKYKKRGKNLTEEMGKIVSKINVKTTTGKAKFENEKERKNIDINNSTIDGKGVYQILDTLAQNEIIKPLKTTYLEGTKKAEEGITINEEGIGRWEGIKVKKYFKNIKAGKNAFEGAIIDINSNLENSEGATSSTRMLYEICKKAGLIEQLPEDEKATIEKFVYFVDFAYRFKQRIFGMDAKYIHGTLFGNYKRLTVRDIRNYLEENPDKTGFETLTEEEAKQLKLLKATKNKEGEKEYGEITTTMETLVHKKTTQIQKALKGMDEFEESSKLTYKGKGNYREQDFIFDLQGKISLLEEVAPIHKLAFCKLHSNNEIYIRSYYDLPPKFGGFTTENANSLHGELTKKNIETFLKEFEGDEEVKNMFRGQFKLNDLPVLKEEKIKKGQTYRGIITKIKEFGVLIQISNNNPRKGIRGITGLLYKDNIPDIQKLKEGDGITIKIDRISEGKKGKKGKKPAKQFGFKLTGVQEKKGETQQKEKTKTKLPNLDNHTFKEGQQFTGIVNNITDFGAFIRIEHSGDKRIYGLLRKSKIENLKDLQEGQKIKIKIERISDEGKLYFDIVKAEKEQEGTETKGPSLKKSIFKVGEEFTGIIENTNEKFGVFIKIKKGEVWKSGLLHKSKIKNLEDFKQGQKIQVKIDRISDKGIGFQLIGDQGPKSDELKKKVTDGKEKITKSGENNEEKIETKPANLEKNIFKVGEEFTGIVDNTNEKFGVFIKIENEKGGKFGLLPKSKIKNLEDFEKGKEIKVKIVNINEKGQIELDIVEANKKKEKKQVKKNVKFKNKIVTRDELKKIA